VSSDKVGRTEFSKNPVIVLQGLTTSISIGEAKFNRSISISPGHQHHLNLALRMLPIV
jgi:hypothetical protein